MAAKHFLLAIALVLGGTATAWAQSATGGNFGSLPSGTAASRSNSGGLAAGHSRHRDSGDSGQSARSSGGGGEIDARDAGSAAPVARQASTPQH